MNLKLIIIDTTEKEACNYTCNPELYDIITPHIVFLIKNDYEVIGRTEINWEETRKYFQPDNNGHCICYKDGSYSSIVDFTHIGVISSDSLPDLVYLFTLSELCDETAVLNNIASWNTKTNRK